MGWDMPLQSGGQPAVVSQDASDQPGAKDHIGPFQKSYPGALFGGGHRGGAAGPAGAHNYKISQVDIPPFYGLTAAG